MNDEEVLAAILVAASGLLLILGIILLCLLIYCVKKSRKPHRVDIPALDSEYQGKQNKHAQYAGGGAPANMSEWPANYEMHVVSHSYAFPMRGQRGQHGNESEHGGSTRIKEMEGVHVNRALENEAHDVALERVTTTTATTASVDETTGTAATVIEETATAVPATEVAAAGATDERARTVLAPEAAVEAATTTTTTEVKTFSQEVFEEVANHGADITMRENSTRGSRPVSMSSSTGIWKHNPTQMETASQYSADRHSITTSSTTSHQHTKHHSGEKETSYYSSFQSRNLSVASSTAGSTEAMVKVTTKRSYRQRIHEMDEARDPRGEKVYAFKLG